ncbi:acetyl-coenzyme A synthetase N-terminal domain-containing protein [Streptantibioticus ferralitis]|uniref:Uncharacterized protein n=1 Tax=Streptantibioticus ferralitis TaxID=236510 RepID=A0ABT5ZB05_9ACTN|nr:acetyl-coenzyme A synthetase N-terminal domain-containing protein [Streptantibioticus ferralitis]MDF2261027.1 hypothetical protein [Streptantibioticus ferralitis]
MALIENRDPHLRALDATNPPFPQWFPDGELNVARNTLDRHVAAGRGKQAALVYDPCRFRSSVSNGMAQPERPPPRRLAAQRRERARIRSEKAVRWGGRPTNTAA